MTITNVITAGDYKGYIDFKNAKKGLYIYGAFGLGKKTFINKDTVDHYEVIGEETNTSFGSGVTRGILGAAAFGAVGAIAGASSAKKKGIHTVSIVFKDGTKRLCDLDDGMFKHLIEVLY